MNIELTKILVLKLIFMSLLVYIGVFVNYFFWQKTGDFEVVILFGLLQWVFWMFPYTIGTFLLTKNSRINYYISSVSAVLTFVVLWLFSEDLTPLVLMSVVAFLTTTTSAFFFSSNTVALVEHAKSTKELNRFIALDGSLNNVISFIMPLVSAVIIHFFGYAYSFAAMLGVSVLFFLVSLTATSTQKVEWDVLKKAMKQEKFTKNLVWYNTIVVVSSRGVVTFGSILLIFVSANEVEMSIWNAITVLVIFILAALMKKYVDLSVIGWIRITMVVTVLSFLIILLGFDLKILIVLQAVIIYLTRYIEHALPFKYIRDKGTIGKIILTYKREWMINTARLVIAVVWFMVYKVVSLETMFILILVSIFISLVIVQELGKKIEANKEV